MTSESPKVDPVLQPEDAAHAHREPAESAGAGATAGGQTLGARLRALRESRGWSVGDVCARLKFAPRQIEALEADQWDALPQGPSLRGMVRNYARLLDADPDSYIADLPTHLQASPAPMAKVGNLNGVADLPAGSTLPGTAGASRGHGIGWVAVVILLLALAGLAAYLFFAWWLPRSQGVAHLPEISLPFAESVNGEDGAVVSGTIEVPALPPSSSPQAVDAAQGGAAAPAVAAPSPEAGSSATSATDSSAAAPAVQSTPTAPSAPTAPAEVAALLAEPDAAAAPNPAATGAAQGVVPAANNAARAETSPTGPFVVPGLSPEAVPAALAPVEESPPVVVPNQLVLQAQQASWIEVRDANGSIVLSATLQPGEERELQPAPPARLVIGNAGGVNVSWQGQGVDLAQYQRGNVARFTLQ